MDACKKANSKTIKQFKALKGMPYIYEKISKILFAVTPRKILFHKMFHTLLGHFYILILILYGDGGQVPRSS